MASQLENSIRERAQLRRALTQEAGADNFYVKKPTGSFVGQWKGFDSSGKGIVAYKGREYKVTPLASKYARKNQEVSLTLTDEGNFASW